MVALAEFEQSNDMRSCFLEINGVGIGAFGNLTEWGGDVSDFMMRRDIVSYGTGYDSSIAIESLHSEFLKHIFFTENSFVKLFFNCVANSILEIHTCITCSRPISDKITKNSYMAFNTIIC